MRLALVIVALIPSVAAAQPTAEQKKATIAWLRSLQDPQGGFYSAPQDPKAVAEPEPMLRATNAAVRSLKYLGAEIPEKEKNATFVLKCIDPKTGGFADFPGGKPDVATTAVGVMAAAELGIPHEKYAKAMDYLKENAKTFEDVRIGAAAVEAWGVKDCPFKLDEWIKAAKEQFPKEVFDPKVSKDGGARMHGSAVALILRLGGPLSLQETMHIAYTLSHGQRDDGGWGKQGTKQSDMESTYRVMRCFMLLEKQGKALLPPKDVKKLREFIESHRNKDGGYATTPGGKSSSGGTYYATIVNKWLDEMEKK